MICPRLYSVVGAAGKYASTASNWVAPFDCVLQCPGSKLIADHLDSGVNLCGSDNSADDHKLQGRNIVQHRWPVDRKFKILADRKFAVSLETEPHARRVKSGQCLGPPSPSIWL